MAHYGILICQTIYEYSVIGVIVLFYNYIYVKGWELKSLLI